MKAKKKPHGIKHKIREERKREERIGLAIIAVILIMIISVSGFFINSMLNQTLTNQAASSTSEPKAAIVDHLSLTRPNQTFTESATAILKQAGYTVDYYPGEKVTVEFYRNLPTHGYKIIVLRVHSGYNPSMLIVGMFSSELYSTSKYLNEQLTNQLLKVSFNNPPEEGESVYFGIAPPFVKNAMKERFSDSAIVMMGCYGLKYTSLAEAFIQKGAKVYISWDGSILGTRNDPAITSLLQHMIKEKKTVEKAIAETMKEFPQSTNDNSMLLYYPPEIGSYSIPITKTSSP